MKFWMKCGKIITNGSGNPIYSNNCPCGYYALFAFSIRYYDYSTGTINECSEPQVDVMPYQVIDNKITYNGICMEINREKDSEGKNGYYKVCTDCWEECIEWDENYENCLQTGTTCMTCQEIKVYKISGCYDDYNDFAEYFYTPCEVSEPYPQIFQVYYYGTYPTEAAYNCIYNYWMSYASNLVVPRFSAVYNIKSSYVGVYMNSAKYNTIIDGYYTWCDGTCTEDDGNGNCITCEGTLHTETMTHEEWAYACHRVTSDWQGNNLIAELAFETCNEYNYDQNLPECTCQNMYNTNSAAQLEGVNTAKNTYIADRDNYGGTDVTNTNYCLSFSYQSEYQAAECWASWAVDNIFRFYAYCADVTINKPTGAPESATGIKCKCYATLYEGTYNNCNNPYQAAQNKQTVIYDGEISLSWGDKQELPIASNFADIYIAPDLGYCNNNSDYQMVLYGPAYHWTHTPDPGWGGCVYPAKLNYQLIPISYIYQ